MTKHRYFIHINDYEIILQKPLEIFSDHALNLGDIINFNLSEIGEQLDFEFDTDSFRIVQRMFAVKDDGGVMCLTAIPHFHGIESLNIP